MNKILILFPNDWDKTEFIKERYGDKYRFIFAGPNLFQLPGLLQFPFFNVHRFMNRMIKLARREGVQGVLSSDEYIGAIIAAIAAKDLSLPHSNPGLIIETQHKYFSRIKQQKYCSEAAVNCQLVPQTIPHNYRSDLVYPFFVKPVKGTFSLFAKKVNDLEGLRNHMNFNWYERVFLKTINKPFNQLLRKYSHLSTDANYFIGEELIEGIQVTVDGFVFNSQVTICGIVDSIMFPGTNIFERFEYPSRLPVEIQNRMVAVVKNLIEGIGFDHVQFNVELFYHEPSGEIKIIEINPRLSYQFGDLYEYVDGLNTYQILLDLTLGHAPEFVKNKGEFGYAASFVLRTFQGKQIEQIPDKQDIETFNDRYKESNIKVYGKKGTKLNHEMRAIGSYRYGIVNVGAHSLLDLFSIYEDVVDSLPFNFK